MIASRHWAIDHQRILFNERIGRKVAIGFVVLLIHAGYRCARSLCNGSGRSCGDLTSRSEIVSITDLSSRLPYALTK